MKTYGMHLCGAIRECLGRPFKNSIGTHLEQSKQKILPPQTPKENNWAILNAC